MRFLGMMSGTSLDAVDLAVVESDGTDILDLGAYGEVKIPDDLRDHCLAATAIALAMQDPREGHPFFEQVGREIAEFQASAVLGFLRQHKLSATSFSAAGFHGQTIIHRRPEAGKFGFTKQLGNADLLANKIGMPVVYGLRDHDVARGGQGAPLAPVFHQALVRFSKLPTPVAVLNLGGVANLTWITGDDDPIAFDVGPANGPLDQLMSQRGFARFDQDGRVAFRGTADERRIQSWLQAPYFRYVGPKSLDRYEFTPDLVTDLSLEDAAATLVDFAAAAVEKALSDLGVPVRQLIVCGGGRRNPCFMNALHRRCHLPVLAAESVGWNGDAVEAQAWAYLAARSLQRLPISFPSTTGVDAPMTGGKLAVA